MNLDRIKKLAQVIKMHQVLHPAMPDFENWSDENLDKYIVTSLAREHRQEGIQSLDMALDKLDWEFMQGLISEKEFELLRDAEIAYWNKIKESYA